MSKGNPHAGDNLTEFRKTQRQGTLESITEAILYLRANGLRVTKKAIADEIGCHENTLRQPYIKDHLMSFQEFSTKEKSENDINNLLSKIARLEDQLAHSRNRNAQLNMENDKLRQQRDEFEEKYRRLLGRYQIDVGKTKISL